MLTSVTIQLQGDKEHRYGSYLGSLLQGYLMEQVPSAFAERAHESSFHPYGQYVTVNQDHIFWHVGILTDAARDAIFPVLEKAGLTEIHLSHQGETLKVIGRSVKETTEAELIRKYYFGNVGRVLKIRFETPTSFKQGGGYMIYPTPRLIFQNLMNRFDLNSSESSIASEDLVASFEEHIKVIGYKMKSTKFPLEGVTIPSFQGELTLLVTGPQQIVNLAWMLAAYGEYSGVGIKTGMGMGGMTLTGKERSEHE